MQLVQRLHHGFRDVGRHQRYRHRTFVQTGHVEQIGDQSCQIAQADVGDVEQFAPAFGAKGVADLFQAGHRSRGGGQRTAQVMADRVEQGRAQLLRGGQRLDFVGLALQHVVFQHGLHLGDDGLQQPLVGRVDFTAVQFKANRLCFPRRSGGCGIT